LLKSSAFSRNQVLLTQETRSFASANSFENLNTSWSSYHNEHGWKNAKDEWKEELDGHFLR